MDYNKKEDSIVLWGTGEDGKDCYNRLSQKYNIVCFIDNYSFGEMFYGKRVYKVEEFFSSEYSDCLIVIATGKYREEITLQLEDMGKHIGKDFMPYDYFGVNLINYLELRKRYIERDCNNIIDFLKKNRKLAALYGNCQTRILASMLSECQSFNSEYLLILVPEIWRFVDGNILPLMRENWTKICSLFICHHVFSDNKFDKTLSSENIISYFSDECKIVFIPNIYFLGYFPQYYSSAYNVDMCIHQSGRFQYGDRFVDDLMSKGYEANVALKMLLKDDFISKDELCQLVEKSFDELKEREKECDVGIVDYLRKHYRARQLFFAPNHPTSEVLWELTVRLLQYLGLNTDNDYSIKDDVDELNGAGLPVYPCVVKGLELNNTINTVYANSGLWDFKSDVRGFLRKYIRICWGK